jgi:hypothetical protein
LFYDNYKDEVEQQESYDLDDEDEEDEVYDFFQYIAEELERDIEEDDISANDYLVINAILEVFENIENFEASKFSKASIHYHIKDQVKLESRELTQSLSRIKKQYYIKKATFFRNKNQ